jgi:hypothetical protein
MRSASSTFLAVIFALLAAAAFGRIQGEKTSPGAPAGAAVLPSSLPYSSQDGLIIVKTTLGSGAALDAVIATGLPLSLITPELASRLAIQGQGIFDMPTLLGPARVQNSQPQQFIVGRVPISNVPVGIFDLYTHLASRPSASAPPIWLGWSALGNLSLTIDPEKRELTLNPSSAPVDRKAITIPFELKDGRIYLQAKLNGHRPVRLLVDTASVGTLIPADSARALKLPELATVSVKGAGGKESRVTAVVVNELTLAGDLKLKDLRALYVSAGDAPDLGQDTGILGTDALLRHKVTINYSKNMIVFERIEPKKDMAQSGREPPPSALTPSPPQQVPPAGETGNPPKPAPDKPSTP